MPPAKLDRLSDASARRCIRQTRGGVARGSTRSNHQCDVPWPLSPSSAPSVCQGCSRAEMPVHPRRATDDDPSQKRTRAHAPGTAARQRPGTKTSPGAGQHVAEATALYLSAPGWESPPQRRVATRECPLPLRAGVSMAKPGAVAQDCHEGGPPRWQAPLVIENQPRGGPFICCTLDSI